MEIGRIYERHTRLTHPAATEEILKLAKEHPNYPITVLAGLGANMGDYGWMYASNVSVGIEEILDCDTGWWDREYVCTSRDDFDECIVGRIWSGLQDELGREPTIEEQEATEKAVKEAHEPYWKKVIAIMADN